MTISLYNPVADAQYAQYANTGYKQQAPKAVLNFGNRRHAFMVLWNPDKIERDYWQVSVSVFGINFVYFGI